jgi:hypothetical protein
MDGPVVKAAMKALEAGDVNVILPYVHKQGEAEVLEAFEKILPLRRQTNAAKELADQYFFETVVRIHRAGEGAAFTGLKPAGLSVGPVIPLAENAIETGSPDKLVQILSDTVGAEIKKRFDRVMQLKKRAGDTVEEKREYIEAVLGLQVYSHKLYTCATTELHEAHGQRVD